MISRTFLLAILLVLAGCSSSGELKVNGTPGKLQNNYESAKLVINPKAASSAEIVDDVRSAVTEQLLSSGYFHQIASANDPADVIVTVDIIDYKRVTVGDRILVAAIPILGLGSPQQNRVVARVALADGRTGSVIRSFDAIGSSATNVLGGEAGYSDALREFSKEVLLGLKA